MLRLIIISNVHYNLTLPTYWNLYNPTKNGCIEWLKNEFKLVQNNGSNIERAQYNETAGKMMKTRHIKNYQEWSDSGKVRKKWKTGSEQRNDD